MHRRSFLAGLFSVVAAPRAARGQKPPAASRIGWMSAGSHPDPFLEGFREGLQNLGYVGLALF